MPKITEMFAFVVCDKNENDEGILGYSKLPGFAMVGANMKRIESLRKDADEIAKQINKPYKILHFKLIGEIK